jgi:uncharacterized protein
MFMEVLFAHVGKIFAATWHLLQDASLYIIIGLLAGGLLKVFLSPGYVASHLGSGRFGSVLKAALLGIPLPLCSCGVLPAAASLKKQGANNGATTAFLISTPESGVDSISISWVLLDPLMTVFRPLSAFVTAIVAGFSENILNPPGQQAALPSAGFPGGDRCARGEECPDDSHPRQSFTGKMRNGIRYALTELWQDLAGPFFIGLFLAGVIAVLVPEDFFHTYLSGGFSSMMVMLVFGIPLYICATASTPIAAALILKGVSPGAALVFLLVGPATNIATISVLFRLLGKRATMVYLTAIAVVSVLCGLTLDQLYASLGISAQAVVGSAAEIVPPWLKTTAALLMLSLSIKPLMQYIGKWRAGKEQECRCGGGACSTGHISDGIPHEPVKHAGSGRR